MFLAVGRRNSRQGLRSYIAVTSSPMPEDTVPEHVQQANKLILWLRHLIATSRYKRILFMSTPRVPKKRAKKNHCKTPGRFRRIASAVTSVYLRPAPVLNSTTRS